jgi:hypothetical protein
VTDPVSTQPQQQGQDPAQAPNGQGQEPTQTTGQEPAQQTEQPREGGSWLDQQPPDVQAEIRRLRNESASYRTKAKELEDRDLTAQQRLERERDDLKQRLTPLEVENMQYRVAAAKDIPLNLASRLRGSTPEELEQDADKLKAEFGLGQVPRTPNFDAGARPPAGNADGADFSDMIRRASGRH